MLFAVPFSLLSCKNNDDNSGTDDKALENDDEALEYETSENDVEDSIDDVAFSIIRELCDLSSTSEDDIETLPSNWKTRKFTPDAGLQLDADNPTVWSYSVSSLDDAVEYFCDLVGINYESESDSDGASIFDTEDCKWSYPGIGSLTLKKVSGNANLFATLDVDISVIPDLKQIQFVPSSVIAEKNPTNSFSGIPYFSAGDVIKRKKDNTYWICVRPAGGPMRKDKSYWISLSGFGSDGNPILQGEPKTYTLPYPDENSQTGYSNKRVTWTYAKKLMTLKTAKAAYHTFNLIANWNFLPKLRLLQGGRTKYCIGRAPASTRKAELLCRHC